VIVLSASVVIRHHINHWIPSPFKDEEYTDINLMATFFAKCVSDHYAFHITFIHLNCICWSFNIFYAH